jgi:ubiquinone/menaquinone biosynthesis C-methylase UbiE
MAEVHDRLREFWDQDSEVYDRSVSHAIADPVEAAAWRAALARHLPAPGSSVLDVGAGTGSISLLAAGMGYRVTALDLSPGMLSRARAKAEERGLDLEFVVGRATEPPEGPFDAVVERNVLWTAPEPERALAAWRTVAPGGRLVLYEALHGVPGPGGTMRELAAHAVRLVLRVPSHHHAEYDPELRAALPLAGTFSPAPFLRAVAAAGWRRIRLERLRDVEWARRMAGPALLGRLEAVPQFAVLAEA